MRDINFKITFFFFNFGVNESIVNTPPDFAV
jgi:hypothetical protein